MGDFYKQGTLFPIDELSVKQSQEINKTEDVDTRSHKRRKEHCNNLDICLSLDRCGSYEMPSLQAYTGDIPDTLIPFHQAISSTTYANCGVHFFIDDYLFERIWNNTERYVDKLSKYSCVIGPDFSQYRNMSYPQRMWNCYRNRVVSAHLQQKGVNIIPNVTWSLPDSYDYSFDGIPENSIIAINCSSIQNCHLSKFLWYKGYKEALKRLNPKAIVRYGTIMQDEQKEISHYFENERLKMLRNGR